MGRTRMTLAVGLVALIAVLAYARGSEPSAPLPSASRIENADTMTLLDEPASLSCNVGWKPVCVIRDGEQACACHPIPGVAPGVAGEPLNLAVSPLPSSPKAGLDRAPRYPTKFPGDAPARMPVTSN